MQQKLESFRAAFFFSLSLSARRQRKKPLLLLVLLLLLLCCNKIEENLGFGKQPSFSDIQNGMHSSRSRAIHGARALSLSTPPHARTRAHTHTQSLSRSLLLQHAKSRCQEAESTKWLQITKRKIASVKRSC